MQLSKSHKPISLLLLIALATTITANAENSPTPVKTIECNPTTVLASVLVTTVLICFVRLVTKKTQPKRIYPKDDSIEEALWYVFDELLVGQQEKGDRASKVVFNSDNPNELEIQYSKIEPRGITGIIYSKMKPVIIPALTMMLLFNKDFKDKAVDSAECTRDFIRNPFAPFVAILNTLLYGKPKSSSDKIAA